MKPGIYIKLNASVLIEHVFLCWDNLIKCPIIIFCYKKKSLLRLRCAASQKKKKTIYFIHWWKSNWAKLTKSKNFSWQNPITKRLFDPFFCLLGFISRELALGSGVASHYFVPADSLGLPVQVQQGWVQNEGASVTSDLINCNVVVLT